MPQVTAAPFPITMGGKTYNMSPLTDKDIDEIDNWLKATYLQTARLGLVGLTPSEREELLGIALDKARALTFTSRDGAKIASTIEGTTRVLWQGLKKNHPEISYDEFKADIFKLKNTSPAQLAAEISESMVVWKELNTPAGQKENPPQPAAPTSEPAVSE